MSHDKILPKGYQLALHAFIEPNILFEVEETDLENLQTMPTMITVDAEMEFFDAYPSNVDTQF